MHWTEAQLERHVFELGGSIVLVFVCGIAMGRLIWRRQ